MDDYRLSPEEALNVLTDQEMLDGVPSGRVLEHMQATQSLREFIEDVREVERRAASLNLGNTARALAAAREGKG